jgi:dihydroxy-acid dehydratase
MIDIDLDRRRLEVRLTPKEIEKRTAELPPFQPEIRSKWLRRYARNVTSASSGAVLRE